MKNSFNDIKRHSARTEVSLSKAAQFQQVLAQLEATLSRKETQKVTEKIQDS